MYMQGYRCNVTNATSTVPVAKAKAPVVCIEDESDCVSGAKQMIAWNRELQIQSYVGCVKTGLIISTEQSGNNVDAKWPLLPAYNEACGWSAGEQLSDNI